MDQAQIRESPPATDRHPNHWATPPTKPLSLRCKYWKIHSRSNFQDAINNIRHPTSDGERATAKPMTSVFYDVIRLEAVRGSSNVPIEGHFWLFLGNLNPKMLSAIVYTQKGTSLPHNACFVLFCSKIHARVTSVGKSRKKREALYFTYFGRRSLTADWHKFWVTCSSRGRNQLCKFYRNRLRGLDSVRGRSLTIPIGMRCRR